MLSHNRTTSTGLSLTLIDVSQTRRILAAVKCFDVLHSVNTKHSDFNQMFVNLLSGETTAIDHY